jgi:hypothetical protein
MMDNINSGKILTVVNETQAFNALDERGDQWGQPPASHYVFSVENNMMRGNLIPNVVTSSSPLTTNLTSGYSYFLAEVAEPAVDTKLDAWDTLSDEDLVALYAEAAEEDLMLAQLGLEHYVEILEQEEESE